MAWVRNHEVTLLNTNIINDKTLSAEAIGVYATMEYMTQNLGYHDITPRDIAEHTTADTIETIKEAMSELAVHGYIGGCW